MLEDYCCLSLAKTDGKFTLVGDSAFVVFYVFSKEPLDILLEINILNCFLLEHGLVSDYSKFSACRRRKDEVSEVFRAMSDPERCFVFRREKAKK